MADNKEAPEEQEPGMNSKKQAAKDLKLKIPEFKGKKGSDPKVHIHAFESWVSLRELPRTEWRVCFPQTLKGVAQTWYFNYPLEQLVTYKATTKAFIQRFKDERTDEELLSKLGKIKQKKANCRQFVEEIKDFARQLSSPPGNKSLRAWFLNGSSLKGLAKAKITNPTKSFKDLIQRAMKMKRKGAKKGRKESSSKSCDSDSSSSSSDDEPVNKKAKIYDWESELKQMKKKIQELFSASVERMQDALIESFESPSKSTCATLERSAEGKDMVKPPEEWGSMPFKLTVPLRVVNLRASLPPIWLKDFLVRFSVKYQNSLNDIISALQSSVKKKEVKPKSILAADLVTVGDSWLSLVVFGGLIQPIGNAEQQVWFKRLNTKCQGFAQRDFNGDLNPRELFGEFHIDGKTWNVEEDLEADHQEQVLGITPEKAEDPKEWEKVLVALLVLKPCYEPSPELHEESERIRGEPYDQERNEGLHPDHEKEWREVVDRAAKLHKDSTKKKAVVKSVEPGELSQRAEEQKRGNQSQNLKTHWKTKRLWILPNHWCQFKKRSCGFKGKMDSRNPGVHEEEARNPGVQEESTKNPAVQGEFAMNRSPAVQFCPEQSNYPNEFRPWS
ncbi:hypothetical protein L7F22_014496 [Adiantum nelumboides]|nr:hypothetical protein [Adiantum nelumboides]